MLFSTKYLDLAYKLLSNKSYAICRNLKIAYEIINCTFTFNVIDCNVNIYSCYKSKSLPINYVIAEFVWIMLRSDSLSISNFNKQMVNFSDDNEILHGAYGARIGSQIESILNLLLKDEHSRRAIIQIYSKIDTLYYLDSKDIPCNTSLQFLIRKNTLFMIVTARSIDFITGLSIDAIQWQFLYLLIYNQLKLTYSNLSVGLIHYNIGSLHVYDNQIDVNILEAINDTSNFKDYMLKLNFTYSSLYNILSKDYSNHYNLMNTVELFTINFSTLGDNASVLYCIKQDFFKRIYRVIR
mgnify:CR=1 FL=1